MAKLLTRYSAEELRIIMDLLEQTSQILGEEAKAIQEEEVTASAGPGGIEPRLSLYIGT